MNEKDLSDFKIKSAETSWLNENFDKIINLKASKRERVRDLASELLDKFSTEDLLMRFDSLIKAVDSKFFFVRLEALRLLKKIPMEKFPWRFSFDDVACLKNEQAVEYLTLAIVSSWEYSQKIHNFKFILKMRENTNKKISKLGDSLMLDVIEFTKPEVLLSYIDLFVKCSKYDFEIAEKALALALKALKVAPLEKRLKYLKFLVNNYEVDVVSGLVLKTISEDPEPKTYPEFTDFFLKSLEKKNKVENQIALRCLEEIEPDKLPLSILVYSQMSNSMIVRSHSKELLRRVSEKALLENLDFLFSCFSEHYYIRFVASTLIRRISIEFLLTEKAILEKHQERNIFIKDFFQSLPA